MPFKRLLTKMTYILYLGKLCLVFLASTVLLFYSFVTRSLSSLQNNIATTELNDEELEERVRRIWSLNIYHFHLLQLMKAKEKAEEDYISNRPAQRKEQKVFIYLFSFYAYL